MSLALRACSLIHAHIQRRVVVIGKAPLPHVQLVAGDAQVNKDAVETTVCSRAFQQRRGVVEVAPQATKARLRPDGGQALARGFDGVGVPVDADQQPAGAQPLQNLAGMARAAQRAIQIDAGRYYRQALQAFVQQHGKVVK